MTDYQRCHPQPSPLDPGRGTEAPRRYTGEERCSTMGATAALARFVDQFVGEVAWFIATDYAISSPSGSKNPSLMKVLAINHLISLYHEIIGYQLTLNTWFILMNHAIKPLFNHYWLYWFLT